MGPWSDVSFLFCHPLRVRVEHIAQRRVVFSWEHKNLDHAQEEEESVDDGGGVIGGGQPHGRRNDWRSQPPPSPPHFLGQLDHLLAPTTAASETDAMNEGSVVLKDRRDFCVPRVQATTYFKIPVPVRPSFDSPSHQRRTPPTNGPSAPAALSSWCRGEYTCDDLCPDGLYRLHGTVVTETLPVDVFREILSRQFSSTPLSTDGVGVSGTAAGDTIRASEPASRLITSIMRVRMSQAFAKFPTMLRSCTSSSSNGPSLTKGTTTLGGSAAQSDRSGRDAPIVCSRKTLVDLMRSTTKEPHCTHRHRVGAVARTAAYTTLDQRQAVHFQTLPLVSPIEVAAVGPTYVELRWNRLHRGDVALDLTPPYSFENTTDRIHDDAVPTTAVHGSTRPQQKDLPTAYQKEQYTIVVWDVTGKEEAQADAGKLCPSAAVVFLDTLTPTRPLPMAPPTASDVHRAGGRSPVCHPVVLSKRCAGLSPGRRYAAAVVPYAVRNQASIELLTRECYVRTESGDPCGTTTAGDDDDDVTRGRAVCCSPTAFTFSTMSDLNIFWECAARVPQTGGGDRGQGGAVWCLRIVVSRCWIAHETPMALSSSIRHAKRNTKTETTTGGGGGGGVRLKESPPPNTSGGVLVSPQPVASAPCSTNGCMPLPLPHDLARDISRRRSFNVPSTTPSNDVRRSSAVVVLQDGRCISGFAVCDGVTEIVVSVRQRTRAALVGRDGTDKEAHHACTEEEEEGEGGEEVLCGGESASTRSCAPLLSTNTTHRFLSCGIAESMVELPMPPRGSRVVIRARQKGAEGAWEGALLRATIVL